MSCYLISNCVFTSSLSSSSSSPCSFFPAKLLWIFFPSTYEWVTFIMVAILQSLWATYVCSNALFQSESIRMIHTWLGYDSDTRHDYGSSWLIWLSATKLWNYVQPFLWQRRMAILGSMSVVGWSSCTVCIQAFDKDLQLLLLLHFLPLLYIHALPL